MCPSSMTFVQTEPVSTILSLVNTILMSTYLPKRQNSALTWKKLIHRKRSQTRTNMILRYILFTAFRILVFNIFFQILLSDFNLSLNRRFHFTLKYQHSLRQCLLALPMRKKYTVYLPYA